MCFYGVKNKYIYSNNEFFMIKNMYLKVKYFTPNTYNHSIHPNKNTIIADGQPRNAPHRQEICPTAY